MSVSKYAIYSFYWQFYIWTFKLGHNMGLFVSLNQKSRFFREIFSISPNWQLRERERVGMKSLSDYGITTPLQKKSFTLTTSSEFLKWPKLLENKVLQTQL